MVNGKPTCANPDLTKTLREDWKFNGYITSDTDACGDIASSHHYAKDGEHATADCLAGGTDINSGGTYAKYLAKSIAAKVTPDADARAALRNAYKIRMRLGLFDPKVPNANRGIKTDVIGSAEHKAASLLASYQSMTLLKNDAAVLPLKPGGKLAVIGSSVDAIADTMGNYNGDNICPRKSGGAAAGVAVKTDCLTSIWKALNASNAAAGGASTLVTYATKKWTSSAIAEAVAAAKAADAVVLAASNANDEGGEGHDRSSIALEASQLAMCKAVLAATAGTSTKVALLLINGAIIGLDELRDGASAILEAFLPGVYGAKAVADTIWGAYNPGGKLPVTMYFSNYTELVNFDDMSMQAGPGRTYRYLPEDFPVVYPFGYGLSYTTFDLKWNPPQPTAHATHVAVSGGTGAAAATDYSVVVTNTGKIPGDEVVLAYLKPQARSFETLPVGTPVETKRLFGFQRVHLEPGASTTLTFSVGTRQLQMVDIDGHAALHSGKFSVVFSRGHGAELSAPITVHAPHGPVRTKTFRRWW